MSDPQPIVATPAGVAPVRFVMLPGAGPACEGDDCLLSAPRSEEPPAS